MNPLILFRQSTIILESGSVLFSTLAMTQNNSFFQAISWRTIGQEGKALCLLIRYDDSASVEHHKRCQLSNVSLLKSFYSVARLMPRLQYTVEISANFDSHSVVVLKVVVALIERCFSPSKLYADVERSDSHTTSKAE